MCSRPVPSSERRCALPEPFATVESVTKSYETESGHVAALETVDATIAAGGTTAIVGVSGSGKSTLLRLIAGLELPTVGRVVVQGTELARLDRMELLRFRRERVAYLSQRAADNLFPHLTVAEHAPRASRELFEGLEVAHRLDARASQLSGGELARAAFAVALARDVPLVVVDEPTAELDRSSAGTVLAAAGSSGRARHDVRRGDTRPQCAGDRRSRRRARARPKRRRCVCDRRTPSARRRGGCAATDGSERGLRHNPRTRRRRHRGARGRACGRDRPFRLGQVDPAHVARRLARRRRRSTVGGDRLRPAALRSRSGADGARECRPSGASPRIDCGRRARS